MPRHDNSLTYGLRSRLGLACRTGFLLAHVRARYATGGPGIRSGFKDSPPDVRQLTLHGNVRGFFMPVQP